MENEKKISAGKGKELFIMLHKSFSNGIRNFKAEVARAWLKEKGLTVEASGATFNSGQIHHRKPPSFKTELESIGFLKRANVGTNNGQIPYTSFGSYSILFPLRNESGEVVNFCSFGNGTPDRFLNDEGIYPAYPHEFSERLFVTTTLLDAATLLESKFLKNKDAVMCIPTGKVLSQHEAAINNLKELKSIVWIEPAKQVFTKSLEGKTKKMKVS